MGRPGLTQHRKFRRLARALGSEATARGSLEFLWDSCYENGDEYLGDTNDVEAAARWNGAEGELTKALLNAGGGDSAGFIQEVPGHPSRYAVHDLWHHAPDYVRKRRKREAERRSKTDPIVASDEQSPDDDRSLTENRRASPDSQTGLDLPPAPAPAPDKENTFPRTAFEAPNLNPTSSTNSTNSKPSDAQVDHIYSLYPRKRDKLAAKKAIQKAVSIVMAGDTDHLAMCLTNALNYLAQRTTLYAQSVQGQDPQYIPYPATWFSAGSFWDDHKDWQRASESGRQEPKTNVLVDNPATRALAQMEVSR